MASDILSFASEVGKTFVELQDFILNMKSEGTAFSFDEVKSYTHLELSDIEKIKEKLNLLNNQNKKPEKDTKTIRKDGKKFKVRKRKPKPKAVEVPKEETPVVEKVEVEEKKVAVKPVTKPEKKVEEKVQQKETVKPVSKNEMKREENTKPKVVKKVEEVKKPEMKNTAKPQEKSKSKVEIIKKPEKKEVKESPSNNKAVIISRPSKKVTHNLQQENAQKSKSRNDRNDRYEKKDKRFNNNKPRPKKVVIVPDMTNTDNTKHSRKKFDNNKDNKPFNNEYQDKKKKKTVVEKRKNKNQKTKVYSSAELEAMEMDSYDVSKKRRKSRKKVKKEFKTTEITVPKASKRIIKLTNDTIAIANLAKEMNIKGAALLQNLFKLGVMATINQTIDIDTATLLASELGYEIQLETFDAEKMIEAKIDEKDVNRERTERAPIVTVMGHVDHGKTKLLDAIRKTNVIDTEAGGITQHIGAYSVKTEGGTITFLDTPGHEAFTSMRARGANVTDIVILIVAADDGIMPQTIEAINHSQAADVPIIVAINKIDKPGINISKIKEELTAYNLVSEDWGGDTIFCEISAKQEIGIENLLENVLLQAEMLELKAVEDIPAKATVVEAFIDVGRGSVTNALIQEGHLQIGDFVVAGEIFGKVRAMFDDKGTAIDYAGPSTPVSILGLNGAPSAGEPLLATSDEKTAKQIATHYANKKREEELNRRSMLSAENLFQQLKESEMKELRIIVKADVQGSVEAVKNVLLRLSNEEVKVNVIHAAVGGILENDINLALASNALVIGFNVRGSNKVNDLADKNGIEIRLYSIIYAMEEDVERLTKGMLEPVIKEVVTGTAEILSTFNIPKIGKIAGCMVKSGKILRNSNVRIIRDDVVIAEDALRSLKRFKDDVKEVKEGYECGLGLQKYNDIKVGDMIESYILEEQKQK